MERTVLARAGGRVFALARVVGLTGTFLVFLPDARRSKTTAGVLPRTLRMTARGARASDSMVSV